MKDQAQALRELAALRAPAPDSGSPRAFVIGSGKGGVGKSVLAALLAAELARRGSRVLLLDGAQNQGNLHVMLGVKPVASLGALHEGWVAPEDLVVPVAPRLWLLPADSGADRLHTLSAVDHARLHYRLSGLYDAYDAVVVDAGPGIEGAVRVASMRAARLVVVAVPEPASLSDAYALIKIMHVHAPYVPVDVLVNRIEHPGEGPWTHQRLNEAASRFLQRKLGYLGAIEEAREIRNAARVSGGLLAVAHDGIADLAARIERESPPMAGEPVAAPVAGGAEAGAWDLLGGGL